MEEEEFERSYGEEVFVPVTLPMDEAVARPWRIAEPIYEHVPPPMVSPIRSSVSLQSVERTMPAWPRAHLPTTYALASPFEVIAPMVPFAQAVADTPLERPAVGGYVATFVGTLDKELECPICLCALRDPVQTECGHLFCKGCFEQAAKTARQKGQVFLCALDKEEISPDKVFPDANMRRKVLATKVICSNADDGCTWSGQLRDHEPHIEECQYEKVPCKCDELVERRNVTHHESTVCIRRQISCLFCGSLNEYKDIEDHVKNCEYVTVPCELCSEELPRREMFDHISEEGNCPNSTLPCQYAVMGCHEKVKRKDMNAHMSDTTISHQQLLFKNLVLLQSEQKKSDCKIKELQKANRELQSENSEMKSALKSLKENFSKQAKKLESSDDQKLSYDLPSKPHPTIVKACDFGDFALPVSTGRPRPVKKKKQRSLLSMPEKD